MAAFNLKKWEASGRPRVQRHLLLKGDPTMNTKKQIVLDNVASVYSGKDGACCCGCSGNHRYASQHRLWAGANRGYAIDDDEISDRSVKLIVGKLNKAPNVKFDDNHAFATVGTRLLIAYFKATEKRKRVAWSKR